MAVQAQYPSNLLFLDRGEPPENEEMDMTRPPHPTTPAAAAAFLDVAGASPAVFFSNGVAGNPRKRARETAMPPPLAPPPEFISLAQLHNPAMSSSPTPATASLVSTGLRLAFEEQQQQMNASSSNSSSLFNSSLLSDDLAGLFKQHRNELDRYLHEQGELLRRALAERRRRHQSALLLAAEKVAARRLQEKCAEVERAARRTAELEERLARLRAETAAWQAKALAEQAAAATLHAQLQKAAAAVAKVAGEECGESGPAESASSAHVDPSRAEPARACRICRFRAATVVLFPCRHLCLCGECDDAGGESGSSPACPVCGCVRTGSVHAILS